MTTEVKPEDQVDQDNILYGEGDLIASGYDAACPACDETVELIEVPSSTDVVRCDDCEAWFKVSLPEHAYQ